MNIERDRLNRGEAMKRTEKLEVKNWITKKVICWTKKEITLKAFLEIKVKSRADLRGADLTGADLTGADLTRADLTGADLTRTDLTGADLTGADLTRADLRGADLRGADLRGADLRGADLTGADLRGADLRGAYLRGADLRGSYLTRTDLTGADLREIKNYTDGYCHAIGIEIIKRNIAQFSEKELSIAFKVTVGLPCWEEIIEEFGVAALGIFKKLAKLGFSEYEERYKKEVRGKK